MARANAKQFLCVQWPQTSARHGHHRHHRRSRRQTILILICPLLLLPPLLSLVRAVSAAVNASSSKQVDQQQAAMQNSAPAFTGLVSAAAAAKARPLGDHLDAALEASMASSASALTKRLPEEVVDSKVDSDAQGQDERQEQEQERGQRAQRMINELASGGEGVTLKAREKRHHLSGSKDLTKFSEQVEHPRARLDTTSGASAAEMTILLNEVKMRSHEHRRLSREAQQLAAAAAENTISATGGLPGRNNESSALNSKTGKQNSSNGHDHDEYKDDDDDDDDDDNDDTNNSKLLLSSLKCRVEKDLYLEYEEYKHYTCANCYNQVPPEFFKEKLQLVKFDERTVRLLEWTKATKDDEFEFSIVWTNDTAKMRQTFNDIKGFKKWKTCCKDALKCCVENSKTLLRTARRQELNASSSPDKEARPGAALDQLTSGGGGGGSQGQATSMTTANKSQEQEQSGSAEYFLLDAPERDECPGTWDGLSCWPPSSSGQLAWRVCPRVAYLLNFEPACRGYVTKQCFSNASWFINDNGHEWSDYSTCSPDRLYTARMLHASMAYVFEALIVVPALLIIGKFPNRGGNKRIRIMKSLLFYILLNGLIQAIQRSILAAGYFAEFRDPIPASWEHHRHHHHHRQARQVQVALEPATLLSSSSPNHVQSLAAAAAAAAAVETNSQRLLPVSSLALMSTTHDNDNNDNASTSTSANPIPPRSLPESIVSSIDSGAALAARRHARSIGGTSSSSSSWQQQQQARGLDKKKMRKMRKRRRRDKDNDQNDNADEDELVARIFLTGPAGGAHWQQQRQLKAEHKKESSAQRPAQSDKQQQQQQGNASAGNYKEVDFGHPEEELEVDDEIIAPPRRDRFKRDNLSEISAEESSLQLAHANKQKESLAWKALLCWSLQMASRLVRLMSYAWMFTGGVYLCSALHFAPAEPPAKFIKILFFLTNAFPTLIFLAYVTARTIHEPSPLNIVLKAPYYWLTNDQKQMDLLFDSQKVCWFEESKSQSIEEIADLPNMVLVVSNVALFVITLIILCRINRPGSTRPDTSPCAYFRAAGTLLFLYGGHYFFLAYRLDSESCSADTFMFYGFIFIDVVQGIAISIVFCYMTQEGKTVIAKYWRNRNRYAPFKQCIWLSCSGDKNNLADNGYHHTPHDGEGDCDGDSNHNNGNHCHNNFKNRPMNHSIRSSTSVFNGHSDNVTELVNINDTQVSAK